MVKHTAQTIVATGRYLWHYIDVIMTTMASQITCLTVVYSTVYSDADQRKHQSSASLAFVWGIHRDRWIPRTKGQLRGKCFHLMTSSWISNNIWHYSTGCKFLTMPYRYPLLVRNSSYNLAMKYSSVVFHYFFETIYTTPKHIWTIYYCRSST